jgi:hypothetical protein
MFTRGWVDPNGQRRYAKLMPPTPTNNEEQMAAIYRAVAEIAHLHDDMDGGFATELERRGIRPRSNTEFEQLRDLARAIDAHARQDATSEGCTPMPQPELRTLETVAPIEGMPNEAIQHAQEQWGFSDRPLIPVPQARDPRGGGVAATPEEHRESQRRRRLRGRRTDGVMIDDAADFRPPPISEFREITTIEEARTALANGMPMTVGASTRAVREHVADSLPADQVVGTPEWRERQRQRGESVLNTPEEPHRLTPEELRALAANAEAGRHFRDAFMANEEQTTAIDEVAELHAAIERLQGEVTSLQNARHDAYCEGSLDAVGSGFGSGSSVDYVAPDYDDMAQRAQNLPPLPPQLPSSLPPIPNDPVGETEDPVPPERLVPRINHLGGK